MNVEELAYWLLDNIPHEYEVHVAFHQPYYGTDPMDERNLERAIAKDNTNSRIVIDSVD